VERQGSGGPSGLQNRQAGAALRLDGSIPSPLRRQKPCTSRTSHDPPPSGPQLTPSPRSEGWARAGAPHDRAAVAQDFHLGELRAKCVGMASKNPRRRVEGVVPRHSHRCANPIGGRLRLPTWIPGSGLTGVHDLRRVEPRFSRNNRGFAVPGRPRPLRPDRPSRDVVGRPGLSGRAWTIWIPGGFGVRRGRAAPFHRSESEELALPIPPTRH